MHERQDGYLRNANSVQNGRRGLFTPGSMHHTKGVVDESGAVLTQCEGSSASKSRELRLRSLRSTIVLCLQPHPLHHDHTPRGFCVSLAGIRHYRYKARMSIFVVALLKCQCYLLLLFKLSKKWQTLVLLIFHTRYPTERDIQRRDRHCSIVGGDLMYMSSP